MEPPSSEELLKEALEDVLQMPAVVRPVSPHPPCCRKKELFPDESVFADIDEQVIKVGVLVAGGLGLITGSVAHFGPENFMMINWNRSREM